jgi:hypothetical protein
LTPLLSKYHDITRHILKQSSLSGASQLDLINFKEEYGPTAFVCQEPGCYRSLVGFPSERQLRDHADGHNKSLRCYEKDCTYNDVGFLTGRSLTSHKRKMHPTEQPKVIPKRLSSTNSSSEVIATDETVSCAYSYE